MQASRWVWYDLVMTDSAMTQTGRNEPCPCGSGKKYKRCHGVDAAPKLSAPKLPELPATAAGAPSAPGGLPFDPSQMDPAMMAQVSQALQRLPRGQLQKLQGIMQKAMSGKDVSREAAELEKMLPPDFRNMMQAFSAQAMPQMMAGMQGAPAPSASEAPMDLEEARKIVEKAAAEGKVSADEAQELLSAAPQEQSSKLGKFWKKLSGK